MKGVSLRSSRGSSSRRLKANACAFTLIDVLVTSAVIALLIGILLPSLSGAQENARRLVCRSNVRQIGLGIIMYADDNNGRMPSSRYINQSRSNARGPVVRSPENLLTLRVGDSGMEEFTGGSRGGYDGLGLLYDTYLSAPKIFYCPSHRGNYSYASMANRWNDEEGEIVGNYHYRGLGPTGHPSTPEVQQYTDFLYNIDPARSSLVADGMREESDYNHRDGLNYFRADLTAQWFSDYENAITEFLKDGAQGSEVSRVWELIDRASEPK